ncbi:MAG: energy transducer TonB, partial [Gammaproteobacteria bacterium]|nr:energy transducer TonB [Gammaproteobacteria bacterium]
LSLGLELQMYGQHEDALDAFKRVLHITRINEGLYTLGQVPIIERMLDSLAEAGLWNDVHRQFDYLYWLNKRNYGASNPRMLPIIDRMVDWHLEAYTARLGVRMYRRLMVAQELNKKAVDIIEDHYGDDDPRLANVLKRQQLTNYYLATYGGEPSDKDVKITISINGSAPNEPSEYERAVLVDYIQNSYSSGREALERLDQIYASDTNVDTTERMWAKVALGDWFLMFGKKRKALGVYEVVHQELKNEQASPARWFAEPQPLPQVDPHDTAAPDTDTGDTSETPGQAAVPYVVVSFDVNEWGKVKDVVVIESAGERQEKNQYQVQRWLRNTRFRPRFENGRPVLTQDLKRRFRFYEDSRGVEIRKVGVGSS